MRSRPSVSPSDELWKEFQDRIVSKDERGLGDLTQILGEKVGGSKEGGCIPEGGGAQGGSLFPSSDADVVSVNVSPVLPDCTVHTM